MHSFIDAFIHPLIHACIYSCIHALIHTLIYAFIHTCIHSFTHAFHAFIDSFIHAFIHAFMHAFIHAFIHACMHSWIQIQCSARIETVIHMTTTHKNWWPGGPILLDWFTAAAPLLFHSVDLLDWLNAQGICEEEAHAIRVGLTDINLRLHVIGLTHNHGSLNEMSSTPLDQRPRRFGLGNDYNVSTDEWSPSSHQAAHIRLSKLA